jgi:hypothetical protein
MFTSYLFLMPALLVLTVYLVGSVSRRHRATQIEQRRLRTGDWEKDWHGTGLDVAAISPRVQQVRADYSALAHLQARPSYYRSGLLTSAARVIHWLPYFQHMKESGSENESEPYAQN